MRVLACIVLSALVAGCTRTSSQSEDPAPALGDQVPTVNADGALEVGEFHTVYNIYVSNPAAGNARYAGRLIEGFLRVDALDTGKEKPLLTQHTALTGDTVETLRPDPSKGVIAEIDDPGPGPAATMGDRLRIRGEIRGYEAGVLTLHRCRVIEKLPPVDPKKDGQQADKFKGEGKWKQADAPPEKSGVAPEKKDR